MRDLLILAPLRLEAALISSGAPALRVRRIGMGAVRSRAAVKALSTEDARALIVMGLCGGLAFTDHPGEVIVADQVRCSDSHGDPEDPPTLCQGSGTLTAAFVKSGLPARSGTIASSARIVHGAGRAHLHSWGADAVEMESGWLAPAARGRPFAVIRVIADTPTADIRRPDLALSGWLRGAQCLRRAATALQETVLDQGLVGVFPNI